MAGYSGYSKSNNAVKAEEEGKYPATVAAKMLGVSAEAIQAILTPCEWHHTSSWYNVTYYYDVDGLDEATISQLQSYKPQKDAGVYFFANGYYLEWSGGSRKSAKAKEFSFSNCLVFQKGTFYTIYTPDGEVKKKVGSNGTYVFPVESDIVAFAKVNLGQEVALKTQALINTLEKINKNNTTKIRVGVGEKKFRLFFDGDHIDGSFDSLIEKINALDSTTSTFDAWEVIA